MRQSENGVKSLGSTLPIKLPKSFPTKRQMASRACYELCCTESSINRLSIRTLWQRVQAQSAMVRLGGTMPARNFKATTQWLTDEIFQKFVNV